MSPRPVGEQFKSSYRLNGETVWWAIIPAFLMGSSSNLQVRGPGTATKAWMSVNLIIIK